jgi:hypothetical protein
VKRRAALILVGLVCLTAADDPDWRFLELHDQRALLVLKPGESKEVSLCWRDVPGGRAPDMAVNDTPELSYQERNRMRSVTKHEQDGVIVTLDLEKSDAIANRLIEHDRKNWVVAAAKVSAGPEAKPGLVSVYVHHAAGTGRSVYRRGTIYVLVEKN